MTKGKKVVDIPTPTEVPPFLKWAGGKRWLIGYPSFLKHFSSINTYIEPFLGSAAVFFAVRPKKAILCDANRDLTDTYSTLKKEWKEIEVLLRAHHESHSTTYYYRVRASTPSSKAERAARFIYLNRVCWNGLYRVNKKGEFNVPIGTKSTVVLPSDNFQLVAKILASARIINGDFAKAIDLAKSGDVVFADPPYTVRHNFNSFVKYNEQLFSWDDQVRLSEALKAASSRGVKVVATNADHASVRKLYKGCFRLKTMQRYSAIAGAGGARGSYSELLITN